jgi:hypothetical protein
MTTTRKPRRKATTDLGRSIMQRERQKLAAEQAALGEALAKEAAARANNQDRIERVEKTAPVEHLAVSKGLVRRIAAALASEGLTPSIETLAASKMKAWTDFEKIHVEYRLHDDVRLLAATLRGLMYHEGGHLRFTMPFPTLQNEAYKLGINITPPEGGTDRTLQRAWNCLEDQRMETAVTSDSPRKAAYFTPMVLTELVHNIDMAAANYPLLIWRRYLPKHIRDGARKLFVIKHGANGEALAREAEAIVERYVMGTDVPTLWAAVVAMEDLLRRIRPLAFDLGEAGHQNQRTRSEPKDGWENALTIPVDPSMIEDGPMVDDDDDDDDDDEPVIDTTDPEVAEHLSEVFSHLFIDPWNLIPVRYVIPSSAPSENEMSDEGDEDEADEADGESGGAGDLLGDEDEGDERAEDFDHIDGRDDDDEDDEDDEDDDDEDDEDFDDEDDDFDGGADDGGGDAGDDDEGMEDTTGGGATGTHTDDGRDAESNDELTDEDLQQAIEDAEDERSNDRALDGDMEAYREALDNRTTGLPEYLGGRNDNLAMQNQADELALRIEESFHAHTADRAPQWVEHQKRGVLNVIRYETRMPWETDFFRQYIDDEAAGFDISVSVLLDYSSSMIRWNDHLAQCGYACKVACDKLDIPCTVTLWDTEARVLYDARDRAEYLPTVRATGGTDPGMALADLDNQRMNKGTHIVLIMTDGEWQGGWGKGQRSLAPYGAEGRHFVGFGFGSSYLAERLRRYGCGNARNIKSLMEIPQWLEGLLLDVV